MDIAKLLGWLAKKDEGTITFHWEKSTSSLAVTLTKMTYGRATSGKASKQICISKEELSSAFCQRCFWQDVFDRLDRGFR